jgi:hypothetical protein
VDAKPDRNARLNAVFPLLTVLSGFQFINSSVSTLWGNVPFVFLSLDCRSMHRSRNGGSTIASAAKLLPALRGRADVLLFLCRIDGTGTVVMGTIHRLDAIVERNNASVHRTFKLANSIIDMSGTILSLCNDLPD